MTTIGKAKSSIFTILFLAAMTLGMMTACSSSEESSSSDCNCAENDWNCKDRCSQPGT